MKKRVWTALPLLALVTACGGGSGSGSVVVPSPAPVPSPTPVPTPTPAPDPTPTPTPAPLTPSSPIAADGNWSTLQGNPAHTGYVAVSFAASAFTDVWTITTPGTPSDVAAQNGRIFYNVVQADNHLYTRAVSTSSGTALWGFDLGGNNVYPRTHPYAPAYANGRVMSVSPNDTSSFAPMQVISAATGAYISTPTYDAQFSSGSVPTPVEDEIFFTSGYYGNVVFNANAVTGERLWRAEFPSMYGGNVQEGESIAVDSNYVYFFQVGSLQILSRNGVLLQSIKNPFFTQNGISYAGRYDGAPMLDGKGHIFTYTDNYQVGGSMPIVAFGLNADKPLWRTGYSYTGQPAVHNDRIYAVRSSSRIVDIIDASTGLLAGSIDFSGSANLKSNVVITDSHLFVASETTTYAVDLTNSGYPVVWSTQFGGNLAITPDKFLIISTGNGLHAVKLG